MLGGEADINCARSVRDLTQMQVSVALALLIGSLAIGVINGHESTIDIAFGKALESPTEEGCARMAAPILVDDVPAEIRGFVRVVDEVPISIPVGCNFDRIGRPDIETSQRDDIIARQFRQIGAIDPGKDVKIGGTAHHGTGASSGIDHAELDTQRLIIGPFALIRFEDADGVHNQERTVRGEKLLSGEGDNLVGKERLSRCREPKDESEAGYSESSGSCNSAIVLVERDCFAPKRVPRSVNDDRNGTLLHAYTVDTQGHHILRLGVLKRRIEQTTSDERSNAPGSGGDLSEPRAKLSTVWGQYRVHQG
jgi:hypothetical protein